MFGSVGKISSPNANECSSTVDDATRKLNVAILEGSRGTVILKYTFIFTFQKKCFTKLCWIHCATNDLLPAVTLLHSSRHLHPTECRLVEVVEVVAAVAHQNDGKRPVHQLRQGRRQQFGRASYVATTAHPLLSRQAPLI
jgi:hypothetical protein